jgi:hypothetical protein
MAVNAELHECCAAPCHEYPWIGDWEGTIVFFWAEGAGVVIMDTDPESPYKVGEWQDEWDMCRFEEFCGKVCLSNCPPKPKFPEPKCCD